MIKHYKAKINEKHIDDFLSCFEYKTHQTSLKIWTYKSFINLSQMVADIVDILMNQIEQRAGGYLFETILYEKWQIFAGGKSSWRR